MGPRQSTAAIDGEETTPILVSSENAPHTHHQGGDDDTSKLMIQLDPSFSRLDELGFIHRPVFYDEEFLTDKLKNKDKMKKSLQKIIVKENNTRTDTKEIFSTIPSRGTYIDLLRLFEWNFRSKSAAAKEGLRKLNYFKFSDETADAVIDLRNKLLTEVGDDILAGTMFCPTTMSTAKNAALDGGPSFEIKIKPRNSSTKNDDDDDDQQQEQEQQEKNAKVPFRSLTIPASSYDVAELYCNDNYCQTSCLGVEGRGTVHDDSLRRSKEVLCSNLELPEFLDSNEGIHKHFSEQVEAIRHRLAASAGEIYFEKYKLCIYKPTDFFKKHQDSVEDEDHFGTLVIHLPCIGDFIDSSFSRRHVDLYSFDLSGEDDYELNEDQLRDNYENAISGDCLIDTDLNTRPRRTRKQYVHRETGDGLWGRNARRKMSRMKTLMRTRQLKETMTTKFKAKDFGQEIEYDAQDYTSDESNDCGDDRNLTEDEDVEEDKNLLLSSNAKKSSTDEKVDNDDDEEQRLREERNKRREELSQNLHYCSQLHCHLTDDQVQKEIKEKKERRSSPPMTRLKDDLGSWYKSMSERIKKDGIMSLLMTSTASASSTEEQEGDTKNNNPTPTVIESLFYQQEDQYLENQEIFSAKNKSNKNENNGDDDNRVFFDPFSMDPTSSSHLLSRKQIEEKRKNSSLKITEYEKRAEGGTLQFFVGRDTTEGQKTFRYSRMDYCTPLRASTQFCATVLMQNYDRQELLNGQQGEDPAFANILALNSSSSTTSTAEKFSSSLLNSSRSKTDNCLKYPQEQRKHLPLHFAAFLTNVLHRVRPIRRGIRMTLQYKIYKRGNCVSPLWGNCLTSTSSAASSRVNNHLETNHQIENLVEKLVAQLRKDQQQQTTTTKLGFGICLRHEYSPAALKPKNLKGIDFKIYELLSRKYECILSSSSHHRSALGGQSWIVRSKLNRAVIPTLENLELFDDKRGKLNCDKAFDKTTIEGGEKPINGTTKQESSSATLSSFFSSSPFSSFSKGIPCQEFDTDCDAWSECLPTIKNVAFLDLGLGKLVGGGCLLGNWDSSFYWFTRQTVLICTLEESVWSRRKILFRVNEEWAKEENVLKTVAKFL